MRSLSVRVLVVALLVVGLVIPALPGGAVPGQLRQDLEAAERRLSELDAVASNAVEDLNEAALALEEAEAEVAAAQAQADVLDVEVSGRREVADQLARRLYVMGPAAITLATMLSADGPGEAIDKAALLQHLSTSEMAVIEGLAAQQVALDASLEHLADRQAEATSRAAELEAYKDRVIATLERQRDEVNQIQARIAQIEREEAAAAARVAEQAARAAAAAAQARAATATVPKPAPGARLSAQVAVDAAVSQVGKPYRWGGSGPDSYDCSGLTSWAWRHAGVSLPHSSRAQYSGTARISRSQVQPGDLLFFGSPIHHVAMAIGDGRVVEAPYSGTTVRVSSTAFGRSDLVGFGRP